MHTIFPKLSAGDQNGSLLAANNGRFNAGKSWQKLIVLIKCWSARAGQRHALSMLDERLLRDIGVNRLEARQESEKPFWRA